MIQLVRSRPAIAIVAFIVGATVAMGVAWAAIPGSANGTITACYQTSGSQKGVLRVIDEQSGANCGAGQAKLRWQADGMRWRGVWSSANTYYGGDVVAHDGSSYVATRPSHGLTPPTANYWALMTAAGATGASGATGPTGATGPSGPGVCGGWPHIDIDWSGCRLDKANLDNMVFEGGNLTNALLSGAHLVDANLHAANLTGANLGDANLTGANVVAAHLNTAKVDGANFTDANLSNAVFTGAVTTGAIWSNTTCPDGSVSSTNGSNPESCVGHGGGL